MLIKKGGDKMAKFNIRCRKQLLLKGYVNITDIQNFCGCGYKKAKKIYDDISEDIVHEGKRISPLGISMKRFLNYL